MRTCKLLGMALVLLACKSCLVGCAFLTPKTWVKIDPINKTIEAGSQQEMEVVVGAVEIEGDNVKVGTATQPALSYGTKSVGVIDANTRLILAEVEMAKTVGPNIEQAMTGIAKAISAASWIGQAFGVGGSAIETLTEPLTKAQTNLRAISEAWANYQATKAACEAGSCAPGG